MQISKRTKENFSKEFVITVPTILETQLTGFNGKLANNNADNKEICVMKFHNNKVTSILLKGKQLVGTDSQHVKVPAYLFNMLNFAESLGWYDGYKDSGYSSEAYLKN